VALAFVQIALGGLVAGHHAGLVYDTWPLMDGRFVPEGLGQLKPAWLNVFNNLTTVQFDHRIGGYVLAAAILAYAVGMRRGTPPARSRAILIAAAVLVQLCVGIATLISAVPVGLALAHQGIALILLFLLVWNASVLRRPETS
jgi:cytochrome c oxidase assembly protein subunit 15